MGESLYMRAVWTVIALALSLLALNPWLAPARAPASARLSSPKSGEVQKVDIVRVAGRTVF
ncbi:MAG: hypothetical protein ACE5JJ_07560, partial [Nitrospinota bacterium]